MQHCLQLHVLPESGKSSHTFAIVLKNEMPNPIQHPHIPAISIPTCFVYRSLVGFQSQTNIFHKNREISVLTIKKKTARLTLPQEATERTKQGETKNKTKNTQRYERKCQSHTCSGTINSSMYDSDLTITTSPLTSSAPYSG